MVFQPGHLADEVLDGGAQAGQYPAVVGEVIADFFERGVGLLGVLGLLGVEFADPPVEALVVVAKFPQFGARLLSSRSSVSVSGKV